MAISFGKTTRGHGKVYTQVSVSGAGDAPLRIESTCAAGAVPAKLLHAPTGAQAKAGDGSYVAVVPVLSVPQTVAVSTRDSHDVAIESVTHSIHPLGARLESSVNTLRKDQAALAIRNIDFQQGYLEWHIEVERIVWAPDEREIIHGTATAVASSREELAGDVEVRILNLKGESVGTPWVCLRDGIEEDADVPGSFMRTIQYSLRIPRNTPGFVVWASSPESQIADGSLEIMDPTARELREFWWLTTHNAFFDPGYDEWFREKHGCSRANLELQRACAPEEGPLFSIVVPIFKTPLDYLDEMARSVLDQTYAKLELILVNASPEEAALAEAVAKLAASDERVRVVTVDENKGISGNTNAGIEVATGDFVCFLDHDDTLTLDALFCYAQAIAENPETDMLYCDEDHIEGGLLKNPFFKPDWSPELLLSMNYVCHMLCIRKTVLDGIAPIPSEFDGSQDHHMALAASEAARHIHHVPRVLYHWRVHPGSTANDSTAKPYAIEAGRRAVQAHLDRTGAPGTARVSERLDGHYEVDFEVAGEPLVSVIIPTKDSVDVLDRCLTSIREKCDWPNYEVILVENNSCDPATFEYYERVQAEDERMHVVTFEGDGTFNYPAINNFGVEYAKGDYLLLLNNDTEVIEAGWMRRMLALAQRPGAGIVGVKLLFPDDTIQHCGVSLSEGGPGHYYAFMDKSEKGYVWMAVALQNKSAVTAACMMVPRSVWDEVDGLDEAFAADYNDVDFCLRVREAGYRVILDPGVVLYHYESISRGRNTQDAKAVRFSREKGLLRERWPRYFDFAEPYDNPNLSRIYTSYHVLA